MCSFRWAIGFLRANSSLTPVTIGQKKLVEHYSSIRVTLQPYSSTQAGDQLVTSQWGALEPDSSMRLVGDWSNSINEMKFTYCTWVRKGAGCLSAWVSLSVRLSVALLSALQREREAALVKQAARQAKLVIDHRSVCDASWQTNLYDWHLNIVHFT